MTLARTHREASTTATLVRDLSIDELRGVIRETVREEMDEHREDLQALGSQDYLRSIEEAREDYREGRVTRLDELLDG